MFIQPRQLFVIAILGWATACSSQPALAQYMPRFKAAYNALVGKNEERKVVVEKQEVPAPKVTEKNFAQVQLAIGDTLAREGNFERAEAAYQAALRNDKSLAGAYHRLARLHEKSGSADDSKELFQKALELEPNNAEIVCDYGYWFYLRKDWKESQRQFQRALQLNPDLKRAHNNLGLLYARTGRPNEALEQFALAGLNPADAHANLGFVYLSDRRMPEAKIELRRAAESNSAKARDVLASLDRFEKTDQPRAAETTSTRLPAVEAPSSQQITRLPAPTPEPSPYLTVLPLEPPVQQNAVPSAQEPTPYVTMARVGTPGQAKGTAPSVEQAPYLSNSTAAPAREAQVAVPTVNTPSYVTVASKQVESASRELPSNNAEVSSAPQFSPVLSDYPNWDTPVAPASAVGFTQKVAQSRPKPRIAPAVPATSTIPTAPQSAPAPAPPKSKSTVRFVPTASR
jgi:Tfp pilus assembly protein PilF